MTKKKIIFVGLTGSIGMGKTTTAKMFQDEGAAIFDADVAVHELYSKGGAAVPILRAVFPDIIKDGAIVRERLAKHLQKDPLQFEVLESFIHPLVGEMRSKAVAQAIADQKQIMVFDVPLLFETGGDARVDKTVVVSANAKMQRERVLARDGMSVEKFKLILSRQMSDIEKRKRADFIVYTDKGMESAKADVQSIMKALLV